MLLGLINLVNMSDDIEFMQLISLFWREYSNNLQTIKNKEPQSTGKVSAPCVLSDLPLLIFIILDT